jgi:hypothetical protein
LIAKQASFSARRRDLGHRGAASRRALLVHQQQGVVVLAEGGRADVAHQQRHALAGALGLGVGQQVVAFGGKADAVQRAAAGALAGATPARMSGFSTNASAGGWPLPSFLIFWSAALAGRQSATAAAAMNTVAWWHLGLHGGLHVQRRLHVDARTPRGVGRPPGRPPASPRRRPRARRGPWQNPSCRCCGW